MKRLITILSATFLMTTVSSVSLEAQNIQLHYDFLRQKDSGSPVYLTSTVEMFRPDKGGSTYFFVDMDYTPKVSGAYWEISREFNFWQESCMDWLSIHIEYDGGLTNTMSFNNAILGGLTYSGHSKDYSKTWSLQALYKAIPGLKDAMGKSQAHNFQITGVWNLCFFKGWFSFDGFFDFWREVRPWQGTEFIFASEPQLWLHLNKIKGMEKVNLSVGSEVELSTNFYRKGFAALPTLALKYTFQ